MRPRRSCLCVPARPTQKLDKAHEVSADEVVVDLEDSVPPELKPEAREAVVEALETRTWAARTVSVRVNASGSEWHEDDVRAVAAAGGDRLDALVVPKVEAAAELEVVARLLEEAATKRPQRPPVGLEALVESAPGLRHVDEIATGSTRLEALILGPADMSVSLGFPSPDDGERWDFVRGAILVAARVAGLQAIDGPFLRVRDLDGLRTAAARVREFGYDGKWALHPGQVAPLSEIFTPTEAEVERAGAILGALGTAGAAMLDGEMIDEASRKRAEQVLARAEAARPSG